MSWSKQLKQITAKQFDDGERFLRAAILQAANVAIIRSPVGNPDLWVWNHPELGYVDYVAWKGEPKGYVGGQFRANWRISFGLPDIKISDSTNYASIPMEIKSELEAFKIGDRVVFSNPMPYGPRLEYDGWSTQAPDGMVRPAVKALEKALNKRK